MKVAVIAYDLKNIKPDDNANAKKALLALSDTYALAKGKNLLSFFGEEVILKFPDTTITAYINDALLSPKDVADRVLEVIRDAGATPDKVYVAFIDAEYLWNSGNPLPQLPSF